MVDLVSRELLHAWSLPFRLFSFLEKNLIFLRDGYKPGANFPE